MNITQIERRTEFSECRRYRYTLWRECFAADETFEFFDGSNERERGNRLGEYLMVVGLNPSTADETRDDPTIRKCVGFARRWGFGALCMTNLFAWRDTKPENMKKANHPIGYANNEWLFKVAMSAGMILAAWGKHGSHHARAREVLDALNIYGRDIYALRLNNDGSPMHPLYVPYETKPLLMAGTSTL